MNQDLVFNNLKCFYRENDSYGEPVHVTILYNNPQDYYDKCMRVFGRPPQYWPFGSRTEFPDEMEEIKKYFQQFSEQPIDIFRIGHCLWAEREHVESDIKTPCPKMPVLETVLWVSPNGSCQCCCYDDTQSVFTVGNILESHILDIWNGPRRKETLERIRNRDIITYPCVNPKCCNFEI